MYTHANKNKDGKIISYRLICSGKNPYNKKQKNYTKTWSVPSNLIKQRDIDDKLDEIIVEFRKEVKEKSLGVFKKNTERFKLLNEYADEWLDDLLSRDQDSVTYYVRQRDNLKVIKEFFGSDTYINQIQNNECKQFYKYLVNRTYTKTKIKVKKSINELINASPLTKTALSKDIGLARITLRIAEKVGESINKSSADTICKYFKIPFSQYFDKEEEIFHYSKSTNLSIKTTLVMLLNEAIADEYISVNYAIRAYKKQFNDEDEKEVYTYNIDEAREFVKYTLLEPDLRKRAVYALFIFMGYRKAEVCGLEWADIDFEKNEISVKRNSVYTSFSGTKTKRPKTKTSKRVGAMSSNLKTILLNYFEYWKELKKEHGDLWKDSKRLFLQENGKPIHPSTVNDWIAKFEAKIGLKHLPAKSLRHTAVSIMLNEIGLPLKVVSKRVGHSDWKITNRVYSHSNASQDLRASISYDNILCN